MDLLKKIFDILNHGPLFQLTLFTIVSLAASDFLFGTIFWSILKSNWDTFHLPFSILFSWVLFITIIQMTSYSCLLEHLEYFICSINNSVNIIACFVNWNNYNLDPCYLWWKNKTIIIRVNHDHSTNTSG